MDQTYDKVTLYIVSQYSDNIETQGKVFQNLALAIKHLEKALLRGNIELKLTCMTCIVQPSQPTRWIADTLISVV